MAEGEQVRVQGGPRRCAFCHDDVAEEERVACASCFAAHHRSCWQEAGSCATCRASAPLARQGEGAALARSSPDRAQVVAALFDRLGYERIGVETDGVSMYRRSRKMLLNLVGETFEDYWIVVRSDGDVGAKCEGAVASISTLVFQRWWHYLTREPWANFVCIGEEVRGAPEPSKRRHFFSPTRYTATTYDSKSAKIEVKTTWTGSIKAKPVLIALRYALESGALPASGESLGDDLGRAAAK